MVVIIRQSLFHLYISSCLQLSSLLFCFFYTFFHLLIFFWIPCHSNSPLYLLLKSSVFLLPEEKRKKKVSTPSSFYDFLLSSYHIYYDCTFSLIGYFYQAGAISFLSHTISRLNNECLINFELHTIFSKELKLFVLNIVSIL